MNTLIKNVKPMVLNIGDEVTCMFGNASDTDGYRASVKVIVLKRNDSRFGDDDHSYLVQVQGEDLIGQANVAYSDKVGYLFSLHCTNARVIGINGTQCQCVKSLGF